MTMTIAVLIACALAFGTKVFGYLIPPRLVEGERTMRISTLLPAALLAGLIVVQTFADGPQLVFDARIGALVVAALLLWRGAGFITVVVAGALTAALLRLAGLGLSRTNVTLVTLDSWWDSERWHPSPGVRFQPERGYPT